MFFASAGIGAIGQRDGADRAWFAAPARGQVPSSCDERCTRLPWTAGETERLHRGKAMCIEQGSELTRFAATQIAEWQNKPIRGNASVSRHAHFRGAGARMCLSSSIGPFGKTNLENRVIPVTIHSKVFRPAMHTVGLGLAETSRTLPDFGRLT
jgi:hypothetical protein